MRYFNESIIGRRGSKRVVPADLETGYIVLLRDNNYYVVIRSGIWDKSRMTHADEYNVFSRVYLNEYDLQLNSRRNKKYDIIEVWKWDDSKEQEYLEFFRFFDNNNKDRTYGNKALIEIIRSGDYEKIFER